MDNDQLWQPFFSVVIPLYNKANQIEKTLESVFAQTYTDYEIVIVDDGSTDGSAEGVEQIIHNEKARKIRLIKQENAGVSAARNRGIAEAHGEYIALLDADDEWKPEYLETIHNLIQKYPQCQVFATNYTHIDSEGKEFPTILNCIKFQGEDGILDNYFEVASHSSPPICSICITSTKKAFESVGGFPVGVKSGEDLLTWARLACKFQIAYSTKPLAIFNVEGYHTNEKPKRIPPKEDFVGNELKKLITVRPEIKSYISHWHKMRAAVFMRRGKRMASIKECFRGLRYNPFNYKLMTYIIINCIPFKII